MLNRPDLFTFASKRNIQMRIYLIGYMGSGKSSMGNKLATRLGYSFLDLDNVIELEQKQSINEIFSEKGEEAFRAIEQLALHQTFKMNNVVISTGGGTAVFFDNMALMKENGLCIYLKANSDVLVSRLIHNQHLRPLIAKLNQEELNIFISNQLSERFPYYEKAQMHIETKDLTPAVLHKHIINWIENQSNS